MTTTLINVRDRKALSSVDIEVCQAHRDKYVAAVSNPLYWGLTMHDITGKRPLTGLCACCAAEKRAKVVEYPCCGICGMDDCGHDD